MALLTTALLLFVGGHPAGEAIPLTKHEATPIAKQAPLPPERVAPRLAKIASRGDLAVAQHRIQSGDTLFAIAEQYHTKVDQIVQKNPQIDPQNLKVGQVLQVPVNTVKKQKTRSELEESAARMVISNTGEPSRYIKMIPCVLTAYSNAFESTGKHPGEPGYGVTASGQVAKEGYTIAVDPALIPMHSIVYIPGIGVRYAEDTGGAVKGSHIDVFMNDDNLCRQFGVRHANVYLIEEGVRES